MLVSIRPADKLLMGHTHPDMAPCSGIVPTPGVNIQFEAKAALFYRLSVEPDVADGALVFNSQRSALGWFLAFITLLVISVSSEPFLRGANQLPDALVYAFYAMNIGGCCTSLEPSPNDAV
jgi:hypothetical protein